MPVLHKQYEFHLQRLVWQQDVFWIVEMSWKDEYKDFYSQDQLQIQQPLNYHLPNDIGKNHRRFLYLEEANLKKISDKYIIL